MPPKTAGRASTPTPGRQKKPPVDAINQTTFTEFKRTIATESVSKFASKDLNKKDQEIQAFSYYHGADAKTAQVKKFMEGIGIFGNIWVDEETIYGPAKIIPEDLHQQLNKTIIKGKNIDEGILRRTYAGPSAMLSGRTILKYSKEVAAQSRKMMSLMPEAVKAGILKPEADGEFEFGSGKTMQDFVSFLLYRMYHWKKFNGATEGDEGEEKDDEKSSDEEVHDDIPGPSPEASDQANGDDNGNVVEDDDNLEPPPTNYLPPGFVFFMTRGPMAEKSFRADLLGVANDIEGESRKNARIKDAKEKAAKRDQDLGTGTSENQRGLPLGASNQKDIAVIAQQQARLSSAAYEADIVKTEMILKSKEQEISNTMDMIKLYQGLGDENEARKAMDEVKMLMKKTAEFRKKLEDLKYSAPSTDVVDEYLKRGGMAMGVKPAAKKAKQAEKTAETSDVED